MILINPDEKEQIARGNMKVLSSVLEKELKTLRKACASQKDDIRHYQGRAYYCLQLCILLGYEED